MYLISVISYISTFMRRVWNWLDEGAMRPFWALVCILGFVVCFHVLMLPVLESYIKEKRPLYEVVSFWWVLWAFLNVVLVVIGYMALLALKKRSEKFVSDLEKNKKK